VTLLSVILLNVSVFTDS